MQIFNKQFLKIIINHFSQCILHFRLNLFFRKSHIYQVCLSSFKITDKIWTKSLFSLYPNNYCPDVIQIFFRFYPYKPPGQTCFNVIWSPELLALATLSEQLHKKFEVNRTKIKGRCQSETKDAELISNSRLPLGDIKAYF